MFLIFQNKEQSTSATHSESNEQQENWLPDQIIIQKLKDLKPSQFEDFISDLFINLGYRTEITAGFHDMGIDIVAEKDGITNYIQCKKLIYKDVSVSQMRDFLGSLVHREANNINYYITTTNFSHGAQAFAFNKQIELINQFKLISYIKKAFSIADFNRTLKHVEEESERCPNCNADLVTRNGRFGPFIGCSRYPRCHYKKKIYIKHESAYSR